ncbi:MAG: hypothetical protein LBH63_00685 [Clostridiales Family XIII bacterium]|jgi:hypothetical protein|nr:hypothetical protein [Clostridiales Family XIII bacterium]
MKQYIVLIAMIALGVFLFRLIMGPDDGALMPTMEGFFRSEIERHGGRG